MTTQPTFPRAKIAYRFAITPTATGVCCACGRWTDEPEFTSPCTACGWGWVKRDDLHTGEIAAAAAFAIAGGVL